MRGGIGHAWRWPVAALLTIAALVAAAPAHAATTLGQTGPPAECGQGYAMTQASTGGPPEYAIPFDGVITSFTAVTNAGAQPIKLVLFRHVGATTYRVAAKSDPFTFAAAPSVQTFETRVPARTGDRLGLYGYVCLIGPVFPGDAVHYAPILEPAVGTDANLASSVGARLDVAAQLEPDADNDGYGDESQDCAPADASKNTDCTGPDAAITGAPKDKVKTRRKRKDVTYTFDAAEPGVTFNCVLDGRQEFKSCTSPLTVSVKKGEHTFSVTASDAAGNPGAAATDSFKVKRRKKRKS